MPAKPVVLVGNSWAPGSAMLYAREHPRRVDAAGGGQRWCDHERRSGGQHLPDHPRRGARDHEGADGAGDAADARTSCSTTSSARRESVLRRRFAQTVGRDGTPTCSTAGSTRSVVPVELVWGDADGCLTLDYAQRMLDGLPRARLHPVHGCGHVPQRECPDTTPRGADRRRWRCRLPSRTGRGGTAGGGRAVICADILGERSRLSPDRTAVVDVATGRRLTYREMDRRAATCARMWLYGLGLKPGDRVGILSGNRLEFLDAFFAAGKIGRRSGAARHPADGGRTGGHRPRLRAVGPDVRRRPRGDGARVCAAGSTSVDWIALRRGTGIDDDVVAASLLDRVGEGEFVPSACADPRTPTACSTPPGRPAGRRE